MHKIRGEYKAAAKAEGRSWDPHPVEPVMDRMLELGRSGRLAGAGFYDYVDGKRTKLWPGLREHFPPVDDPAALPLADLAERMLFIEAIEAVKCVEEGVIESVADANVGSILGIGFPGWTGGVLQYINGYSGGPRGFVVRAAELANRYGARFEPPDSLVAMAGRGETYVDRGEPAVA
jgi:3-hydroxyacyl-CoA dehydrogenase/enoyl-CoA hydratase/3-hydroxybutyryl-CoA epimerase